VQEAYLCHDFGGRDFYGAEMKLMMCAFLRPQLKFDSFDELITAITDDVSFGKEALDTPSLAALRHDPFLQEPVSSPSAATPAPATDH
jgi:riboflavin kinase